MKQIRCFMLGRARSGTTVFRRMLSTNPDLSAYSEILNADAPKNFFQFLERRYAEDSSLCYPQHSLPLYREFLDELCAAKRKAKCVLFDIKYECMHVVYKPWYAARDVPAAIEEIRNQGWHALNMTRRNHLKRIVSNTKAMETGVYHDVEDGAPVPAPKVRIGTGDLMEKFDAFDEAYDRISEFFAGYDRFLEVDYDRMFVQSDGTQSFSPAILENVAQTLGLPNAFDPMPRQVKVTSDRLSDVIENYDEVASLLAGTPYAAFLDEPAPID